jgi:parallel beta helix pectate lyase-like protein
MGGQRNDLVQRHRWPTGGRLIAWCAAIVVVCAGLTALALGLLRSTAAGPASPAAGPASPAAGPVPAAAGPASPPARVCGNQSILGGGPSVPPKGAVTIPAGDDSGTVLAHNWTTKPNTTYWFAPGRHTLGTGQYSQIIPANGDTFIGARGAILDGQRQNLYAFTGQARNVTIRYLTIQNFGGPGDNHDQGVVNHDEGRNWRIDHITVQDSAGAGVMLGSDNVLAYSCLRDNGQYGFQGFDSHITVDHNEIVGNNTDNWEARQDGCGCTGGAKFWSVNEATITSNYVHDNAGPGLWADTNNRGFDVEHNYLADNQGVGFIYEISYNLRLADNTFVRNALVAGPKLGGFPDSAVYISESGADSRVPGPYGETLAITGNTFTDNWGGVVLYENADRHCNGSNSSTGYCTLVNPSVATISKCGNPSLIGTKPYYDDCRWKTQNVLVSHNIFTFDPARVGPKCTLANYCGFNGIFSGGGSWPPYDGSVVEDHITFDQDNRFMSNIYNGPWQFMVHDQGQAVDWGTWQGNPYHQDAGSTMDSNSTS